MGSWLYTTMKDSLLQKFRSNAKFLVPIIALSITLGISIFYSVTAPLPPNNVVGIIYKTDEGIDADQFGEKLRYSVHLCLFVEDKINGEPVGDCRSYQVDSADYESVEVNDIVRGQVKPGPFRGYNIIDIQEIHSGAEFVQIVP
jgi:hypothetical protein